MELTARTLLECRPISITVNDIFFTTSYIRYLQIIADHMRFSFETLQNSNGNRCISLIKTNINTKCHSQQFYFSFSHWTVFWIIYKLMFVFIH